MAGSIPDEDESVLGLSNQSRRPKDTAYRQQRILSWNPYLDPFWVICAFFVIGAIFVPVGIHILELSDAVVEIPITYDAWDDPNSTCGINTTANANKNCSLSFVVPKDMSPPILVHYEISNFHQNHRAYKESLDLAQLAGSTAEPSSLCDPLKKLGDIVLNPCGLIANTLFNDVITLASGSSSDGTPLVMMEEGIAWQSDIQYLYNQPNGFLAETCPGACDETCCQGQTERGLNWSCTMPYEDPETGECSRFFYPKEDTTQYLYETYPKVVSPIEGVLNEHFIVWMRVAALPTFRKLYGWINQPISAGEILRFDINANWEVQSFEGKKTLIVSSNNIFGGKNDWLGWYFVGAGSFTLAMSLLFGLKQLIRPRKVADKKYLVYKEE